MKHDADLSNIASRVIAAASSLLLLIFSLVGPIGAISPTLAAAVHTVATAPTPTPKPTHTPTPTPKPTHTRTPRPTHTPTPKPKPTHTPAPRTIHTPTYTSQPTATTTSVLPQGPIAGNTPTSTVTLALTHNGGTPARKQKSDGVPLPFTPALTGALIVLGIVLLVGLLYLLQYLSPSPHIPLRPGSAHLRGRVQDRSLQGNSPRNTAPHVDMGSSIFPPALDDPHLVDRLQEDARTKAWELRQSTTKMRRFRRE